jgi:hypothetical protein
MFMEIEPLTLRTSLKSLHIRLFDEDRHKMIGYHREDGPETTPVPATGVAAAPASATGAD